jgi:hypothetical protein
MWIFSRFKKNAAESVNQENRPIKIIKTGHNSWQIVYADVKEN